MFDTHAHLISDDWDRYRPQSLRADLPTPPRTRYTVTAEALIAMMDAEHVQTACVVQRGHLYGHDNSYIIDSARKYPNRLLPVVILDAQNPETPARFSDMVKQQGVRGFRMANTRPLHLDTAWMSSPAAMQVWQACADLGAPMTLIFFRNQLPYVLPLLLIIAKMYPQLPILIDHLGTAYGMSQVEIAWAKEAGMDHLMPPAPDYGIEDTISIFESTPNVYFKFTAINLECMEAAGAASPAAMVRRLADRFGAGRLVWGTDVGQSTRWPFAETVSRGRAAAGLLGDQERSQFLHDNAARIYARVQKEHA